MIKLKDVFLNEIDYLYLTKIYDSNDDNFNYKLKIFEIDYKKLNSCTNCN